MILARHQKGLALNYYRFKVLEAIRTLQRVLKGLDNRATSVLHDEASNKRHAKTLRLPRGRRGIRKKLKGFHNDRIQIISFFSLQTVNILRESFLSRQIAVLAIFSGASTVS